MKYTIPLAMVLALLTSSCKKKEPTPLEQLPPITQNGANTFGCLINGEPAYTTLYDNWWAGEGVKFTDLSNSHNLLIVRAITINNIERRFRFGIKVPPPLELKTYQANIVTHDDIEYGCSINDGDFIYLTDSLLPASITFTKYTGNGQVGSIISGTFDMYMTNYHGDTLHLTNGRFDIKKQ